LLPYLQAGKEEMHEQALPGPPHEQSTHEYGRHSEQQKQQGSDTGLSLPSKNGRGNHYASRNYNNSLPQPLCIQLKPCLVLALTNAWKVGEASMYSTSLLLNSTLNHPQNRVYLNDSTKTSMSKIARIPNQMIVATKTSVQT